MYKVYSVYINDVFDDLSDIDLDNNDNEFKLANSKRLRHTSLNSSKTIKTIYIIFPTTEILT